MDGSSQVESYELQAFDRMMQAAFGRVTQGVSPSSLMLAYLDWTLHLTTSPSKWMQLSVKARRKILRWIVYAMASAANGNTESCIEPLPQDHRFRDPMWKQWPFNLYCTSFLLTQQWWHNATTEVRGVSRHHEQLIEFTTRQMLDFFSPYNFAITNPCIL